MAKTIKTKVYLFSELESDRAKQNAMNWYLDGNSDISEWAWEGIKSDAENVGLKIEALYQHKANKGHFVVSAIDTAQRIIENHGEDCETRKTAESFIEALRAHYEATQEDDAPQAAYDEKEEAENEFLQSLLQDYWHMYQKEMEYQSSEEALAETLEANEYAFTEDGKRFG